MMSSIKLCRLLIVVLLCYITWSHCVNITATTPCKLTAAQKTKLTKVNASVTAALKSAFLTQLVNGGASLDDTICNTMKSVYAVPLTGLLCLVTNYKNIWNAVQTKTFTLDNVVAATNKYCVLFTTYINSIKTAANTLITKFGTSTPGLISPLPPNVIKLVNGVVQFVGNWSAATSPSPALTKQFSDLVTFYKKNITQADKKKVVALAGWTNPWLLGAQKTTVNNALGTLNTSVNALAIKNNAALTKQVNPICKAGTNQMPKIATWILNKVNKISVSSAIKSDSTVKSMASTVASYGSSYGPTFYNQFYPYVVNAVGGCYKIVF